MISLDVVGDSYSDEEHMFFSQSNIRKDSNKTYLELLREKNFKIKNYSWHGIGASQAVERLRNISNNNENLLFILPQIKRVKFHDSQDDNVSNDYKKYKDNALSPELMKKYQNIFSTTLFDMYDTLCLTYVFNYSKIYKKIFIWPVVPNSFKGLNNVPSNCFIANKPLNVITNEEPKNSDKNRNNHLIPENHEVLSDILYDYFAKNIVPKFVDFVVSCNEFIYE